MAPPTRTVFYDDFLGGKLDTAKWHSGYFRYNTPIDQSRAWANGEHNRYAPEMVAVRQSGLHLGMERDTGGSRDAYVASCHAVAKAAQDRHALMIQNGNTPAQIEAQRLKVEQYSGPKWDRAVNTTWRSGLVVSNDAMVRKGMAVEFLVLAYPKGRGIFPAGWLFDSLIQRELDVFEGNWQRKLVGHRHSKDLGSTGTALVQAPNKPFRVKLWLDGETLRWYLDGVEFGSIPIGDCRAGRFNIIMNFAMACPKWAFIGVDDAATKPGEIVFGSVTVTAP